MATLTSTLRVTDTSSVSATHDLDTAAAAPALNTTVSFASGTGTGQVDLVFADIRTIAASGSENLDLAGGGLTDPLGNALTFVTVKKMTVTADSGNTNNVVLGNGTNPFIGPFDVDGTGVITVGPGDVFCITHKAGWAVTAATGDILKVANSGGTTGVTYSIKLEGTSA